MTAALARLEEEAKRAEAVGDPMADVLRAFSDAIVSMEENRQPVPVEEIRRAANQAFRSATAGVVKAINWRTTMATSIAVVALCLASFVGGYVFHGNQQMVAGVSAGAQECRDQGGGTLCYIPIWSKLPPHS